MHQRARHSDHIAFVEAERHLALDDIKGFIPRVVVWWRAAAFGPSLQENLIAAGLLARSEHSDLFAHDIERPRARPGMTINGTGIGDLLLNASAHTLFLRES